MAENVNINVTENIDQVNVVASEIVEVVDLNLYATTEDVTINVTEEIIQVNINKVQASNITKTSDLINDGEDGVNPFITLEDIPPIDVSTLVPYTGATQDVDLGEFELKAGQVEFDTTPTGTAGVGVMRWNDSDGTLDLGLKGGNVTLQLGQEQLVRAVNKTSTNITLLESNYQAVRVTGAQGQRLKVDLALATNDLLSAETIGLVTETIANNQEGFITISGLVRNINTTGSLQGETWNDGDILYLSPTTAGKITNIKPTAPNHLVIIGYVVYAHSNNGSIFVKVDNGYELEELHNVSNEYLEDYSIFDTLLAYDVNNSIWKKFGWGSYKTDFLDVEYSNALYTYEELNKKQDKLFFLKKANGIVSVTGTLSETQVYRESFRISSNMGENAYGLGFFLNIFSLFTKLGTASGYTIRVKLSTSSTMPSGSTDQIALYNGSTSTLYAPLSRIFSIIRPVNLGNMQLYGFPFTSSSINDANISTTASSSRDILYGEIYYLYVSVQLTTSIADTVNFVSLKASNV